MSVMNWFIGVSCVGAVAALAGCSAAPSAQPAEGGSSAPAAAKTVLFASNVKPILDKHCHDCHRGGGTKGGFNLDTRENALLVGLNGARIVEGNGSGSKLILRVSHDPSVKPMPPKGEALSADEVATLRAWIDQGAKWE